MKYPKGHKPPEGGKGKQLEIRKVAGLMVLDNIAKIKIGEQITFKDVTGEERIFKRVK